MKTRFTALRSREAGFTLVELLVVVAILGSLAGAAIPNVGKFVDHGKYESYGTELHNIQTAAIAMLVYSETGTLFPVTAATADMDDVRTTDTVPLILSDFLSGLNPDGTVKSGCTYAFSADGTVVQTTP